MALGLSVIYIVFIWEKLASFHRADKADMGLEPFSLVSLSGLVRLVTENMKFYY